MRAALLVACLTALVPWAKANTGLFEVDADTRAQPLYSHMRYLPDPSAALDIDGVLARSDWRTLARSNLGYRDYPVWTRLTLRSTDAKPHRYILYNPRPGTNRIDVYVRAGSDGYETYALGAFRPAANHALRHRFTAIALTVPAQGDLTIITRVRSAGPLEVGWMLSTIGEFSVWTITENLLRGLVAGAMLTMVLYSLILWFGLRQPVLLAYVAFGTTLLLTLFSFQGVYRIISFGLPQLWFFYGTWVFACLMTAAMIAIGVYFFDTRVNMPRMHRWLKFLLVTLAVNLAWIIAGIWENSLFRYTPLMHLLLLIVYFSLIITAIAGVRMKLTGAAYYLAGHGSLLAALAVTSVALVGWVGSFSLVWMIIPAGSMLDIVFLAKAISQRLGRMKRELELQRENALVQSRFASVGKTIGMITHQWRTPLARQGAVLTEMQMLLGGENSAEAMPRLKGVLLPRMQEALTLLNNTVSDFRSCFSADNRPRTFDPADIIDQTLALITWQRRPEALRVQWRRPDSDIILDSYPATLAHVLMILVENAIDVFREREIANPALTIGLERRNERVRITVEDNGGGIRVKPVERIFSGFFSDKRRQSSGMGLYIARMLVEEHLGGTIAAENRVKGARLSLNLPLNWKR